MTSTDRIAPDLATVEERARARGLALGSPLVWMAEVSSTNDLAKRAARDRAPHGAIWVADSQTAGRGRQGRAWSSAPGENLLFSVLLRTPCPLARLPELCLVAGLAVRDAVARALGDGADSRVLVKWPNDVLVADGRADAQANASPRKIAGILVESTLTGAAVESLVVGIGINVHTLEFPSDLAERATSVARSGGAYPDRGALLLDVLEGLDRDVPRVAALGLGLVHDRLLRACALRGKALVAGELRGTCEGIDRDGKLLVRRDDGSLAKVSSGEVHLGTSAISRVT